MTTLMNGNPLLYNTSSHSQDYYRFFEVGLGFFLRDGFQSAFVNNYDYKSYSQYFGGKNDITTSGTRESLKLKGRDSLNPKKSGQPETIFLATCNAVLLLRDFN